MLIPCKRNIRSWKLTAVLLNSRILPSFQPRWKLWVPWRKRGTRTVLPWCRWWSFHYDRNTVAWQVHAADAREVLKSRSVFILLHCSRRAAETATITWVDDAFNAGMVFQVASNGEAVFHVLPHSKVQSFQTAVDQETIERRRNRSNSWSPS